MIMESCNSRQGLLVKSGSNVTTNSSEYFDDFHGTDVTSASSLRRQQQQQHPSSSFSAAANDIVNNDNVAVPPLPATAQFYIGIDDTEDTTTEISSHFSSNSTALISTLSSAYSSSSTATANNNLSGGYNGDGGGVTTGIQPDRTSVSSNKVPLLTEYEPTIVSKKSYFLFGPPPLPSPPVVDHDDTTGMIMANKNGNNNPATVININGGGGSGTGHPMIDPTAMPEIHSVPSSFSVGRQILAAVFIAAAGNWAAGLILDNGKSWNVFRYTPELYYLVPILLSLKGNLEMTMVARLSTLANMGQLKSFQNIRNILFYNITLVQSQAIVVSVLASVVTLFALRLEGQAPIDLPPPDPDDLTAMMDAEHGDGTAQLRKILLIFATSLATANIACLLSSILMILFTVTLHHLKIDPDNFVTAVAASFGDIITSALVGLIGEAIYNQIVHLPPADPLEPLLKGIRYYDDLRTPIPAIWILAIFLGAFPFFVWYTCRDRSTKQILFGLGAWIPILMSMLIAFVSGFVLRFGAVDFNFMSLFQPLINGVGGNLAAISASRYSTELHVCKSRQENGSSDKKQIKFFSVVKRSLKSFYAIKDSRNFMILVFIAMAGIVHLFYGILAPVLHASDHHEITPWFYVFYIPAALLQVLILLILTRFAVDIVWSMGCDPDTSAIPILTSMGDILGTVFLYTVFVILRGMGDKSATAPLDIELPMMQLDDTITTNLSTMIETTTVSPTGNLTIQSNLNNLTSFGFINYLISNVTTA